MKINYNGHHHEIDEGLSLASFLDEKGIDMQTPGIAVACNERIVVRPDWQKHSLAEGDRVEVVHAVQGG